MGWCKCGRAWTSPGQRGSLAQSSTDVPKGKVFSVGGNVKSLWISKGCANVIFIDADKCWDNSEDNVVIQNAEKVTRTIMRLPPGNRDNICRVKAEAKKPIEKS